MAPEIIKNEEYDSKIDVWSAGIVSYMLLTGLVPFGGSDDRTTYEAILND